MLKATRKCVVVALIAGFAGGGVHAADQQETTGKHYNLPATLDTVQWGWFDLKEAPKLTVNSGDTVSVETMMHSHDKVRDGVTMQELIALRKANPGGGPHSLTGPI